MTFAGDLASGIFSNNCCGINPAFHNIYRTFTILRGDKTIAPMGLRELSKLIHLLTSFKSNNNCPK